MKIPANGITSPLDLRYKVTRRQTLDEGMKDQCFVIFGMQYFFMEILYSEEYQVSLTKRYQGKEKRYRMRHGVVVLTFPVVGSPSCVVREECLMYEPK